MGASTPGRSRGGRRRTFNEINVTPFVDVMLVLLIIFMVTAPMLTAGIEVDLPETSAAQLKNNDKPISISVTKDGRLYIQENEVELNEIAPKLQAIAGENSETKIIIRGDEGINYGLVMQAAGEVSNAGFTAIALETTLKR